MEQQHPDSGGAQAAGPAPGARPELGPVAVLAFSVRDGSIGLDAAQEQARAHGARGEVTVAQVQAMANSGLSMAHEGRWRDGRTIVELCYAAAEGAAEARPGEPAWTRLWLMTGADLIQVLHAGLLELGDIGLCLRAREVAGACAPAAREARQLRLEGLVSQQMGMLLLDAYTAGRDPATPRESWPPPLAALTSAGEWLNRALPIVAPQRREDTLKALAQLAEWRAILGADAAAGPLPGEGSNQEHYQLGGTGKASA